MLLQGGNYGGVDYIALQFVDQEDRSRHVEILYRSPEENTWSTFNDESQGFFSRCCVSNRSHNFLYSWLSSIEWDDHPLISLVRGREVRFRYNGDNGRNGRALLFRNDNNLVVQSSSRVVEGQLRGGSQPPPRVSQPVLSMGSGREGTEDRSWYLSAMDSMTQPPEHRMRRALPRGLGSHRGGFSNRNGENEVKRKSKPKREINQQSERARDGNGPIQANPYSSHENEEQQNVVHLPVIVSQLGSGGNSNEPVVQMSDDLNSTQSISGEEAIAYSRNTEPNQGTDTTVENPPGTNSSQLLFELDLGSLNPDPSL